MELLKQVYGFIKNSPVGTLVFEARNGALIFIGGNESAARLFELDFRKVTGLPIEKVFPNFLGTTTPGVFLDIALYGKTWETFEQLQKGTENKSFFISAFQTFPGHMMALLVETTAIKQTDTQKKMNNEILQDTSEKPTQDNNKLKKLNEVLLDQQDRLQQTIDLLKQSEEKFKTAFRTSPDSVNLNRLSDGLYIEINEGFTQLTGYTWEDVLGKTSADINIWHDINDRFKMISLIRKYGKAVNMEAKFRLKNGEIKTGLISARILDWNNEQYILSVVRDIEEIVTARALLKESELRFRQFVENVEDIFWISEGEKLLYLNPAAVRMFGKDFAFFEDFSNGRKMVHPDDYPVFDELIHNMHHQSPEQVSRQFRVIDESGVIRWIWMRVFPFLDQNRGIARIAGIASEITRQKEYESELKTAKEKALESDQLKSAFLANVSHEIRTPLNGILGFTGFLTKNVPEDPVNNHYVHIINKCSEQLLHIIDDLVEISKIEANQLRLSEKECNISSLLDDLTVIYELELKKSEKNEIRLIKDCHDMHSDEIVLIDEYRLRQIMVKLLDNAVKYTQKGYIRFGCKPDKSDHITFFVEDTGIGISDSQLENIFKPFRQADANSALGGAGLGLSICRGLVKLMKGRIWVESQPDKGSVFYFSFPFKIQAPVKEESFKGTEENRRWEGKKVLIVEDDDMNYAFLEEMLMHTGMDLSRACNGIEAVDLASKIPFDLIIMDIRLPVMNGLDSTKRIREKGIHVPIIAQTAYAMSEDKKICLEAGCDDYVSKPIHRELFLKKVGYHLYKKEMFPPL